MTLLPHVAHARTARELGYTETQTSFTSVPATRTDVPNMSVITFEVVAGKVVYVELILPTNTHQTVGGNYTVNISDNAGADAAAAITAQSQTGGAVAANGPTGPARVLERITVPGTYSRKAQARGSTASDASRGILGSATIVQKLRAWEAVL